jgi:NAD(P)-dependent dehydrogenase (short-subunit alcohol dehydrogenase family)
MGCWDRFRLDGRIAIVTGASSGLGVAFAQALAEVGATVVPVLVQRLVAQTEGYRELRIVGASNSAFDA